MQCYFNSSIVPATSITTTVTDIGPAVAGYNYTITCSVTLTEGLTGTPSLFWTSTDGTLLTSAGDIVLSNPVTSDLTTSMSVFFDPVRESDEGTYVCMATLSSPALTRTLNSTAVYNVTVQQSKAVVNTITICTIDFSFI